MPFTITSPNKMKAVDIILEDLKNELTNENELKQKELADQISFNLQESFQRTLEKKLEILGLVQDALKNNNINSDDLSKLSKDFDLDFIN